MSNDKVLKLYILSGDAFGYDSYNRILVAAYSKEEAVLINPYNEIRSVDHTYTTDIYLGWGRNWSTMHDKIKCTFIGLAKKSIKPNTVIMEDYRAG